MASVELNPLFNSFRGKIGDIVFYNTFGKEYARIYVKPQNPDTSEQRTVRKTFGDAVRAWQKLSDEEKYRYERKARRAKTRGYNLYISLYMKDNLATAKLKNDIMNASPASTGYLSGIQELSGSVATPFQPAYSLYDSSLQLSSG